MRVCLFGRTGWIGQALEARLSRENHEIVEPARAEAAVYLVSTARPAEAEGHFDEVLAREMTLLERALADVPAGAHFVFTSSGGSVYADSTEPHLESEPLAPSTAYGRCKVELEQRLARETGRPVSVARIANVYGPWPREREPFGVINRFIDQAVRGHDLAIFGDPLISRDFVHVDDVCEALAVMARSRGKGAVYNIASGVSVSLADLKALISETEQVRWEMRPGRAIDVKSNVLRIDKAAAELGWEPRIDLRAGVRETLAWRKSWS